MCTRARSIADSVCMVVAMALKLHTLEPGSSFILGTMEVVMLLRLVLSRAQVRALYSYGRQLCFAEDYG